MNRKVRLSRKAVQDINRQNAHGQKWATKKGKPISPDFICKCYDMYKQGRMTSRQLLDTFPGRTMKAVESKVWKIRGRSDKLEQQDPNQTDLFTRLLK